MLVPVSDTRLGGMFDALWRRRHVCGACGGRLVEATTHEPGVLWVGCSDRTHEGFERVRGWYERWKAGESVPGEVAEGLRKLDEKRSK